MRKNKKSFFTLLEVLVSMGVFSLLMLALMQFFSAAQGVWERTGSKAEIFESAKTTMGRRSPRIGRPVRYPDAGL